MGKYLTTIVDMETGEVLSEKVTTPSNTLSQQKIIDKIKNRQGLSEYLSSEVGGYFMLFYDNLFNNENVTNANKMRFIYITTFMNYDGYIVVENGKKQQRVDRKGLKKLANLNPKTFDMMYRELVSEGFLTEEKDGIMVNKEYGVKGALGKRKYEEGYARVFIDYLRKVYTLTKASNHGQLYYFFLLIPYIHVDLNVICKNPTEEDYDKIEKLTLKDIANILGYNPSKYTRMWKDLEDLFVFTGNKDMMPVFIRTINKNVGDSVAVNPRLYYKGSNLGAYQMLEVLFLPSVKKQ